MRGISGGEQCADDFSSRGGAQHLGDAEIGDFDAASFVEQQVLGLDVAMHNAAVMGKLQRIAKRRDNGERLLGRELAGAQQLPEIRAIHEFHQQKIKAAGLAEIMNRNNVRVIQSGERLRLAGEAFGELGIVDAFGSQ